MEILQLFITDSSSAELEGPLNNNYHFTENTLLNEINQSIEVMQDQTELCCEDLETELGKREKELFLCSELGLYLSEEIENVLFQWKNLVSDHTRVLLDLQSYETSKKSFLDLSDVDGATDLNDTLSTLSCFSPDSELSCDLQFLRTGFQRSDYLHNSNKLSSLQSQIFKLSLQQGTVMDRTKLHSLLPKQLLSMLDEGDRYVLKRSESLDSFNEVQSIPESTFTAFSNVTKNLQSDLDKLQHAHEHITRLEVQLDSTRAKYRKLMTDYSRKLKEISQSLGSCVEKARPYFDTVMKARQAQIETQQATIQFKRAVNLQKAGRDMVKVAEERLSYSADKFDTTWQEMLNQATSKVNEASREKDRIHAIHMKATKNFKSAEEAKNRYQVSLQRNIVKAKPYFEVQQDFQIKLEATTKRLNSLEVKLLEARQSYTDALSSIRQSGDGEGSIALDSLAERGIGVGAENSFGDDSVLPKPMQDILRHEAALTHSKPKKNRFGNVTSMPESKAKKSSCLYNQYDLVYLNDTGSETGSGMGNGFDDYIQDF